MTPDPQSTRDDRRPMAAVGHTNPETGETAGQLFARGPTVRADGGTPSTTARADGSRETESNRPMSDVSHTPPRDADDANRVFVRGDDAGDRPGAQVE